MAGSVENVYAQALLEIGREDGSLKELDEELNALSQIFAENPELTEVLSAPTVTESEKLEIIKSVFDGKISQTSYNFLCLIAQKDRCKYISGIAREFRNGYYESAGIAEVTATTVVPLSDNAKARLVDKLSKLYGKSIILKEKTDPSIIGGMIVTCGDSMLDGSVKTKLENMHKQIKETIAG